MYGTAFVCVPSDDKIANNIVFHHPIGHLPKNDFDCAGPDHDITHTRHERRFRNCCFTRCWPLLEGVR